MTFDEARCRELEAAILAVIGVSREQIASPDRTQRVAWARVAAAGLLRERTTMGHGEIARRYNRERTTMISHGHTFASLSQREPYASQVREIRAMIGGGNAHDNGPQ